MQSGILQASIGIQFFILVGYLLYLLFKTYSPDESRVSLTSYVAALLVLITLELFFSLVATVSLVPYEDKPAIIALALLDMTGIVVLGWDLRSLFNQDENRNQNAELVET